MQKIIKSEPEFFKSAKRKVRKPKEYKAWNDDNIVAIKPQLKEYIINEQNSLCAYCERKLEDIQKLSIDHFKKRDLFPEETLEYTNLFISCPTNNQCEKHKDNFGLSKEDYEKIIHPVFEEPEEYLTYDLTGYILPKDNLDIQKKKKAEFTIKVFNLNNRALVEDRKKIINILKNYLDDFNSWEEIRDSGIDIYFSLLRWIYTLKGKM